MNTAFKNVFLKKAEEEFRDSGKGFGLLGVGTGSVKMNVSKNQKAKLSKIFTNLKHTLIHVHFKSEETIKITSKRSPTLSAFKNTR